MTCHLLSNSYEKKTRKEVSKRKGPGKKPGNPSHPASLRSIGKMSAKVKLGAKPLCTKPRDLSP